jgi:hypothetical protein
MTTFPLVILILGFAPPEVVEAAAWWEQRLSYPDRPRTVLVASSLQRIDGPGGYQSAFHPLVARQTGRLWYAESAVIRWDTEDWDLFGRERRVTTAIHELAHALGAGYLWDFNRLIDDGQYVGKHGVAAYREEFGRDVQGITLSDLTGGQHFAERYGGLALTGIRDQQGRDLRDEIMTTWSPPGVSPGWVSATTVMTFADMGFVVRLPAPVLTPARSQVLWTGHGVLQASPDLRNWTRASDTVPRPDTYYRLLRYTH